MSIEPLDGIADVGYSVITTETLSWQTATDWDNSPDEAGVVHEGIGDYAGGGVIQLGYPSFDRGGSSLGWYFPLYEDSVTAVNDVSGNGRDGTSHGNTLQATGLWNTDTYSWNGSGDYLDQNSGIDYGSTGFTFSVWFNAEGASWSDERQFIEHDVWSDNKVWQLVALDDTTLRFNAPNWSSEVDNTVDMGDSDWHNAICSLSAGGQARVYFDGTKLSDVSRTNPSSGTTTTYFGGRNGNEKFWSGRMAHLRLWTRAITDPEAQAVYDAGTTGYLETGTKSFSSPTQPNLEGLSYTLNSQSIDVDIIGSPGTASEEIVSQTLDGASSYPLSWSNNHTDFRVKPILSASDEEVTPTVNRVELVG